MQPYFFPYIAYFQLINAVDKFVFYDDVNFIKQGWINRNKILNNGKEFLITIPCCNISSFKKINEIEIDKNNKRIIKLLRTIETVYYKAPFFKEIFGLINSLFNKDIKIISELAIESVVSVSNYLNVRAEFILSSEKHSDSLGLDKADRLIKIAEKENADTYINPIGGIALYDKKYFAKYGIQLYFLKSKNITYKQFNNNLVPWLSIIDVIMFNHPDKIREMLKDYELI